MRVNSSSAILAKVSSACAISTRRTRPGLISMALYRPGAHGQGEPSSSIYGGPDTSCELSFEPCKVLRHRETYRWSQISSRDLGSHRSFSGPHVPGVMHHSSPVLRIGTTYGGPDTYHELYFEPCQPQGHQVKLRRSPVSSCDLGSYRAAAVFSHSAELISAGFKRTCSTLYTDGATEQ